MYVPDNMAEGFLHLALPSHEVPSGQARQASSAIRQGLGAKHSRYLSLGTVWRVVLFFLKWHQTADLALVTRAVYIGVCSWHYGQRLSVADKGILQPRPVSRHSNALRESSQRSIPRILEPWARKSGGAIMKFTRVNIRSAGTDGVCHARKHQRYLGLQRLDVAGVDINIAIKLRLE